MTTQTYHRARHSVSALQAHLVLITTYRRPVFTDEMLTFAENTMRTACSDLDVEPVEFNGETDHLHLLLAYPPTIAISTLIQRLKGRTAHPVRHQFTGRCVRARMRGHPWSPSYFAVSREGAPLSIIKQYIHGPTASKRPATPSNTRDGPTPD